MTFNVAIWGSCVSRDNFNSSFNPRYGELFECTFYQHQTSLSVLGNSAPETTALLKTLTQAGLKPNLPEFCLRQGWVGKLRAGVEVLIIDLFADSVFDVYLTPQGRLTARPEIIGALPAKFLSRRLQSGTPEHLLAVTQGLRLLLDKPVVKRIPNKFVVVFQFENEFPDGSLHHNDNNVIARFQENHQALLTAVLEDFQLELIDLTDRHYLLNPNHLWGRYFVHFEQAFYSDFLLKLTMALARKALPHRPRLPGSGVT